MIRFQSYFSPIQTFIFFDVLDVGKYFNPILVRFKLIVEKFCPDKRIEFQSYFSPIQTKKGD